MKQKQNKNQIATLCFNLNKLITREINAHPFLPDLSLKIILNLNMTERLRTTYESVTPIGMVNIKISRLIVRIP